MARFHIFELATRKRKDGWKQTGFAKPIEFAGQEKRGSQKYSLPFDITVTDPVDLLTLNGYADGPFPSPQKTTGVNARLTSLKPIRSGKVRR